MEVHEEATRILSYLAGRRRGAWIELLCGHVVYYIGPPKAVTLARVIERHRRTDACRGP